jgi:hypothetical protein
MTELPVACTLSERDLAERRSPSSQGVDPFGSS